MATAQHGDDDKELSSLGLPLAEFRVGVWRVLRSLLAGVGLLFVGGVGLLMAYGAFFIHHNPVGVVFVVTGLLFAVLGVTTPWHVTRNRHLRILLGPHGVARLRGAERAVLRWDEIGGVTLQGRACLQEEIDDQGQQHLWLRITSGQSDTSAWTGYRAVILSCADGAVVRLEDYVRDFDRLARAVQQETMARLWPTYLEAYRAGDPVPFGVLSAGQAGLVVAARGETLRDRLLAPDTHPLWAAFQRLALKPRPPQEDSGIVPLPKPGESAVVQVPWDQVRGLRVLKDTLVIDLKDGKDLWIAAGLLHVVNAHLLLRLARDLAGVPAH